MDEKPTEEMAEEHSDSKLVCLKAAVGLDQRDKRS